MRFELDHGLQAAPLKSPGRWHGSGRAADNAVPDEIIGGLRRGMAGEMVLLQFLALVVSDLRAELTRFYAAMSNNVAMNVAWALMSLPRMFRTCPFLIMAIAS
jgi:hypothetical protein